MKQLTGLIRLLFVNSYSTIGTVIILFWIFCSVFAGFVATHNPYEIYSPFIETWGMDGDDLHILGTDSIGRDIFSRIIFGARTVLLWAPLATGIAYVIGIVPGLFAGYLGGRTDDVLSYIANIVLSFPVMVLYILILTLIGSSGVNILLAVIFASSPAIYRIVRAKTLELAPKTFVQAARVRGEHPVYILFVEILPNASTPLIIDFCLRMGYTTITIGVLGFLGLGFPPPTADWGGMISENKDLAMSFPFMTIWPCLAISSFVLGLNLLADGLKQYFEIN